MQFEDYRFEMGDSFGLCGQPMSCPSTGNSFSSASSAYDPYTPNSRRSTPNELSLDLEAAAYAQSHGVDMTPPSSSMGKYFFGPVKTEAEQMSFTEMMPNTPNRKMDGMNFDYEPMLDLNMAHHNQQVMGSLTPSHSFGAYAISPEANMAATSFMMTPTQSLSGSDIADSSSSWSCTNDSPISFFAHKQQQQQQQQQHMHQHQQQLPGDFDVLSMERHSQPPMERYSMPQQHYVHGPPSPNRFRAQRKMMMHEAQRRTTELQRAQIGSSSVLHKRSEKPEATQVDVVRRAMCKCDYPGCHKAFRRNEHLKRHKQTFHGEGPNRFSCEFCGKDQFNRQDNLNNHRKLHARPNSRNRGVEFIPGAVPIIEQEERSRKRRAPPKSKMLEKRSHHDY